MAVTLTSRFGLTSWGAGSDPFTRAQRQSDNQQIETLGAIDLQGTFAARPAAGKAGRYYWATDTSQLFRDNGTTWSQIFPNATGSPSALVPGNATATGSSALRAAADHVHSLPAWAAGSVDLSTAVPSGPGSAATFARGDHGHGLPSNLALKDGPNTFSQTNNFTGDVQQSGTSLGRGIVGFASVYGNVNGPTNSANEAVAASVTFTPVSGRKYRFVARAGIFRNDAVADTFTLTVRLGSVTGTSVIAENVTSTAFGVPQYHQELFFIGDTTNNVRPANGTYMTLQAGGAITLVLTFNKGATAGVYAQCGPITQLVVTDEGT